MKTSSISLALMLCGELGFGHGYHHHEPRHAFEKKDLGQVIAVKRFFPLDSTLCEKTLDPYFASCYVKFVENAASHDDFSFPIPPITLPTRERVLIEGDMEGYTITYYGLSEDKKEQLSKIEKAIELLAEQGIKNAVVQLYRPAQQKPTILLPFKETNLGNLIGVKRKVPIRYSECVKNFEEASCWVGIIDESVPDYPGPPGGGEVSKAYEFSAEEKVVISLENLYGDYLISYYGPETFKDKILEKIAIAINKLKGAQKELFLECTMFTLKKSKLDPNDTLVKTALFFEVEMPFNFELCKDSHDEGNRKCSSEFPSAVGSSLLDHPGGGEMLHKSIPEQGSLDVYAAYLTGDVFWKLSYELLETASLKPLSFLDKAFQEFKSAGRTTLKAFGFQAR